MFFDAVRSENPITAAGERNVAEDYEMGRTRKVTRLLIIKAACDLLLVLLLAGSFFFAAFNPYLDGHVEVGEETVKGYITVHNVSDAAFDVQLFVDDAPVAHKLMQCSYTSGDVCEFQFELPVLEGGKHEVRIYASKADENFVQRVLQVIGEPQSFVSGK
jgi:hypothetical protein